MGEIQYKPISRKKSVKEELEERNILVVIDRLKKYFNSHHGYDRGLRGLSAEDFAMTTLEKIISGKRSWERSNETDFLDFCTAVMSSEMHNFRNSIDYNKVINFDFDGIRNRWDRNGLNDEFEGF